MYALKQEGLFNRHVRVYKRGDDGSVLPLGQEDFGQEFLDFLMGRIRNNSLRDGRPWGFYLNASCFDSFDGIRALVDKYHYPISQGNLVLKAVGGKIGVYSTITGLEFD